MTDGGVTVGLAYNPDGTTHAGYGGIGTCGSVWCCPQCAAVVATRRADELVDVMRAVDHRGGSAWMVTLTVRHQKHDRLGWSRDQRREAAGLTERIRDRMRRAELGDEIDPDEATADRKALDNLLEQRGTWDAVGDAWQRVISGGTWVKDQQAHGGLLGWVRVVETTVGRSGWHVHIHALLCFADDPPIEEVRPIVARMFRRWKGALEKAGYDASGDLAQDGKIPGWDVRRAQLDDNAVSNYFTKLAHEVTSAHRKEGRGIGGRTPMQLLADVVETYEATDMARWWEWESASDGRRQLTWSGGNRSLRDLAGLGQEQTDEEIAAEELPADERIGLAPETWGWVRATQQETAVLDVAEIEGMDGLRRWLGANGQEFVTGAGVGWVEMPDVPADQPVPRDQGVGLGWLESTPAVLREHDSSGRPLRRPSDRPPRWTDDARAAL